MSETNFTHLHVHTQYSILDGASAIAPLVKKAADDGMPALAITDHGNMYGVPEFMEEAKKQGIKPIIGCEMYVTDGRMQDRQGREDRSGYHMILLAKNMQGYRNLSRLCSLAFLEGFYYTSRIDKELLFRHHEGLIATSSCIGGEIPQTILNKGEEAAEAVLMEYLDVFKDDFYLELQRHGLEEQETVNRVLIGFAKKHNLPLIATNDCHFINADDARAHDILVCLQTGRDIEDDNRMRYSGQEYLKTRDEMAALFSDVPEALKGTMEIAEKVESYDINAEKVLLPHFPLAEGFTSENDYLRHLTYEGAGKLYPEITDAIRERLDFELKVIGEMGFAGYFLIVQDFINKAREMDVSVGPGRGSVAGSAVAFATGITTIDPIRYNLLFERFLNPERISMPDIDIDFDDEGRERVLQYVIEKYGREKVAQIVTFGTMAARSSIRDVARVLKLPLPDADRLAKLVPDRPGTTLEQAYKDVPELNKALQDAPEIVKETLKYAKSLEGSNRQTGVHACGVIIGPSNLIDCLPLSKQKDTNLPVTQYEGKYVEKVGMLKMDFLGLKTLSIIKEAIKNIEKRYGTKIDIEKIPLDDEATYRLYQRGDTIGTFQFESQGMREYLKELRPSNIEDLIAMNALYRPGPMDYIPMYIKRKHGMQKVEYPHPWLEDILKPTFGIMVYQEQIMQAAQIMAGFTLATADILRRAMGKKKKSEMDKQKMFFIEGALNKGIDKKTAQKIFDTMARFAEYGFNRSHSAAYSVVAYRTAYLKANYTAEYMAAVLTNNFSEIKKITFIMEECQRQKIPVLGPDVNESTFNFVVNDKGQIRFGLGAIKGVGEGAVESIANERETNGSFKSIFDFAKRVNLRNVNKRVFESLAKAGAFDCFENVHRAQFFHSEDNGASTFIDRIIRHTQNVLMRENTSQMNLFEETSEVYFPDPEMPRCEVWSTIEMLKQEKEVTGMYISGHPLDNFKIHINSYCSHTIEDLKNPQTLKNKEISFAGIITAVSHKYTKNGNPYGTVQVEDYSESMQFFVFAEDYLKVKHFLEVQNAVMVNARVQPNRRNPDQLDIRVKSMSLLSELAEREASDLMINLPVADINRQLIQKMKSIAERHKGKAKLKIYLVDPVDNNSVEMLSRNYRIEPVSFLQELLKHYDVNYRLN
ncbi:MAG: DNA polymerase III subunit alpha [Bacteroidia bacterium]|nr:MAG: DNA polymerase III subunit alpha [Bacteroidia bacterium]